LILEDKHACDVDFSVCSTYCLLWGSGGSFVLEKEKHCAYLEHLERSVRLTLEHLLQEEEEQSFSPVKGISC